MYVYVYTYIHTYIHIYMHVYIYIYMYTYRHAYTHTHTDILYINTYTDLFRQKESLRRCACMSSCDVYVCAGVGGAGRYALLLVYEALSY